MYIISMGKCTWESYQQKKLQALKDAEEQVYKRWEEEEKQEEIKKKKLKIVKKKKKLKIVN